MHTGCTRGEHLSPDTEHPLPSPLTSLRTGLHAHPLLCPFPQHQPQPMRPFTHPSYLHCAPRAQTAPSLPAPHKSTLC